MERAAAACFYWLEGGGYLAVLLLSIAARGIMEATGWPLRDAVCPGLSGHGADPGVRPSGNGGFQANLARFIQRGRNKLYSREKRASILSAGNIVIDALFVRIEPGLEGVTAALVEHINSSGNEIIASTFPAGCPQMSAPGAIRSSGNSYA